MRTVNHYELETETIEEQIAGQRHNPATVLIRNRKRMILACGSSDDVHVFRDQKTTLVLSVNYGLEYAGIQTFNTMTGEEESGTFMDSESLRENIGDDWEDLMPITLCRYMTSFIP